MDEETYKQYLLTTFQNLQQKHEMQDPTYIFEGYNASCGDNITMFIKTKESEIIEMSFLGNGCLLSQVSAELLAQEMTHKTIDDLTSLSFDKFLGIVGITPSPTRMRCIELPLMTAKRAINKK